MVPNKKKFSNCNILDIQRFEYSKKSTRVLNTRQLNHYKECMSFAEPYFQALAQETLHPTSDNSCCVRGSPLNLTARLFRVIRGFFHISRKVRRAHYFVKMCWSRISNSRTSNKRNHKGSRIFTYGFDFYPTAVFLNDYTLLPTAKLNSSKVPLIV